MSAHFDLGCLLYQQNRHADAEREFKLAILEEPDSGAEHAMLARVYLDTKRVDDAEAEAKEALRLDPAHPFSHLTMGLVLLTRNRFAEAEAAAGEALRIDSTSADTYALLGAVRLNRRDFAGARSAAESGLGYDPAHVGCSAIRTQALTQLGDRTAALEETAAALRRRPDDPLAHAGRGWAYLHAGQPKDALTSFREALRLDPTCEWARAGMIEALKARHWLYRQMLRWFLWMSRLPARVQIGLLVGVFAMSYVIGGVADLNSPIRIPALVALGLLATFAVLTWIAQPLFNLILMTSRHGRLVLRRAEKLQALVVGVLIVLVLACIALHFTVEPLLDHIFLVSGFTFLFMLLPVTLSLRMEGGRRTAMLAIAAAMFILNGVVVAQLIDANEAYQRLRTMNDVPKDPEARRAYKLQLEAESDRAISSLRAGRTLHQYSSYLLWAAVILGNSFAFIPQRR